jgi:hypothetical protein
MDLTSIMSRPYNSRKHRIGSRPWHPRDESLMEEVRFEEGGVVVPMRNSAGEASKLLANDPPENSTN